MQQEGCLVELEFQEQEQEVVDREGQEARQQHGYESEKALRVPMGLSGVAKQLERYLVKLVYQEQMQELGRQAGQEGEGHGCESDEALRVLVGLAGVVRRTEACAVR